MGGGAGDMLIDGGAPTALPPETNLLTGMTIGSRSTGINSMLGAIAAVLVYDRLLTDPELATLDAWSLFTFGV